MAGSQILQVLPASTHGVRMQPNQCMESYLNQADVRLTATTARSHDFTSVSALTCPPPGLSSHGAAAPTSTYSEALALTPPPRNERSQSTASPRSRIPFSGSLSNGPRPQNGRAPIRQEHPVSLSKGAKNSLSTASARPQFLPPIPPGLGEEPSLQ